jgi:predicted O-linked N-acetylglucosamine transferase (SPINDLY family)
MTTRLEEAMAFHRAGRLDDAERAYAAVVAHEPTNAKAHLLLSGVLQERGRPADAERSARDAVRLAPNDPIVQYNLGEVLRQQGKLEPAIAALRTATTLSPTLVEGHINLGIALQAAGRFEDAIASYRAALAVRQDCPEANLNLGVAFQQQRRLPEAIDAYQAALKSRPDYVPARYSLGVARFEQGDLDAAEAEFRQALSLQPDHEPSRNYLAYTLQVLGRYGEAAALYRRAAAQGANAANAARFLALASVYDPDADIDARYDAQRQAEDRFARPLYAHQPRPVNLPDPERRLRIGYLTSDFKDHPVARNMELLLAARDRGRFEVVAYADIDKPDGMTQRLQSLVDGWRAIEGLGDEQVAAQIRADGVDILVLLANHFDRNRPLVAAYRPAPVQISFHDLITSGLEAVDYFIADRVTRRPHAQEKFTERVIRLPSLYAHPPIEAPEPGPPPCASRGYVTFGSFNNPAKVNDRVLALWARVLREVPASRLALKFRNWFAAPSLQARIRAAFAAEGVNADRLRIDSEAEPRGYHLARYADIDIALDPFPFSGSTTTFEALWMGLPVITLAGETVAARWSASMLHALKFDELIADTPERYIAIARELAADGARIARFRASLRRRVADSPLCNGPLRARQIERVYRAVWRRWCARQPQQAGGEALARAAAALEAGRLDEAVASFLETLDRNPEQPAALYGLGIALGRQRNFAAAVDAFRGAVALRPEVAEMHGNLGAMLRSNGQFDAAELSLREALRLNPDLAPGHANFGLMLFDQGRIPEAIAAYDRGLQRNPGYQPLWRNRIATVLYDPARDETAHRDLLRRYEAQFAAPVYAQARPADRPVDPERRLRVGYVSSDLIDHPVARNLRPVLEHRDREKFELVAYAEVAKPDAMTGHLKGTFDLWRTTVGWSEEQLASQIRADGIDILVCLAGRLDYVRPLLAAYRSAPVQVSFHDPGTSGLTAFDYLIADRVLVPPRSPEWFSERVVRLPWFYVHAPLDDAPPLVAPPCAANGYITFGSFNNPAKVNGEVLRLWTRILREVPRSRLVLKFRDWFQAPGLRTRLRSHCIAQGVDPTRLELGGENEPTANHLVRYNRIDIALDPFPFTGATTTFEALWMGVPVVTLCGAYMAGRWGTSILRTVGLDELIARTPDEYAEIAQRLANYPSRLAEQRASSRQRVADSPLCDGRGRARQVERLYRAMWRRWCARR